MMTPFPFSTKFPTLPLKAARSYVIAARCPPCVGLEFPEMMNPLPKGYKNGLVSSVTRPRVYVPIRVRRATIAKPAIMKRRAR